MKILVTGGAGFIGTNLCEALAEAGHSVTAIDNLSVSADNVPRLEAAGVQFVKADISEYEEIEAHFKGIDAVYHLAAMNRAQRSIENPRAANASNVTGTLNVLDAMRIHKVPKIVFVSSSSVYAGRDGALKEDGPLSPPHPYGVGKLAGEHYVRIYGELFGIQWVTLRLFSVYGPYQLGNIDKAGAVAKFIHLAHEGKSLPIYGDGTSLRNFTYVADVVRCLMLALEKTEALGHVINIANPEEITVQALAETVVRESGSVSEISHEPQLKGDPSRNFPDTSKAKELLGYEPEISAVDGVRKTIEWFRANGAA